MRRRTAVLVVSLLTVIWTSAGGVLAEEASKEQIEERVGPVSASDFSGSITLGTEYVFRGISQTNDNPTIQGSFGWAHSIGVYAGVWGSNLDDAISDGNIEIDLFAGYAREFKKLGIGDLTFDVGAIYYWYPGDEGSRPTANFFEGFVSLSYAFSDVLLEPTIGALYNFSPDFFGLDGTGHYVSGRFGLSLPLQFGLGFEYGYQAVGGGETSPGGFSYSHWKIAATKEIVGFELELNYQDTSGIDLGDITDSRVVFLISRSF
jgi:uncharacterized protein (TIGR02001 family)